MSARADVQPFSADQLDALRELANVGVGRAADAFADLLNIPVVLTVPDVRLVEAGAFVRQIIREAGPENEVTAVRQSFTDDIEGEAIVVYYLGDHDSLETLVEWVAENGPGSVEAKQELLLEMGNIIVGASIGGFAEQLGLEVSYTPPSIMAYRSRSGSVLERSALPWTYALVTKVLLYVQDKEFGCYLLAFFPEQTINKLRSGIDALLGTA